MATGNVECPKCGARSTKSDFGQEPNRVLGRAQPKSSDPVIVKRRERARKIRNQNKGM